jgi:hypothetical protein
MYSFLRIKLRLIAILVLFLDKFTQRNITKPITNVIFFLIVKRRRDELFWSRSLPFESQINKERGLI